MSATASKETSEKTNSSELICEAESYFQGDNVKKYESWDEMDLKDEVLRGLYAAKFDNPSKIQASAIMPMKEGNDIIAQAQSGSGKTGAFVVGVLEKVNEDIPLTQAIILANTKELASQIKYNIDMISNYTNIKSVLCVGGTNKDYDNEIKEELKAGNVHIVVGTPGKTLNLIRQKRILTSSLKILVLDEADELLGINFEDQIKDIITSIPVDTQICIFSATYNKRTIFHTTENIMVNTDNIVKINIKKEKLRLDDIKQYYVFVGSDEYKLATLLDLYGIFSIAQTIIYVNKKKEVEWLANKLIENNYTCGILHGDIDAKDRVDTMKEFRKGTIRVLIASDLIARGIDVEQVKLVINFDLPTRKETYIHRIGRTGRFGRKGVSINFVTKDDERMLDGIMKHNNTEIEPLPEKDEFQQIMKDLTNL